MYVFFHFIWSSVFKRLHWYYKSDSLCCFDGFTMVRSQIHTSNVNRLNSSIVNAPIHKRFQLNFLFLSMSITLYAFRAPYQIPMGSYKNDFEKLNKYCRHFLLWSRIYLTFVHNRQHSSLIVLGCDWCFFVCLSIVYDLLF